MMAGRWRWAILAATIGLLPAAGWTEDADGLDCSVPDGMLPASSPLPLLAGKIAKRQPITVVVVGSSSSAQPSATSGYVAYPTRLRTELESRFPGIAVTVVNRAVPGRTATAVAGALGQISGTSRPDLVVWEAGTTDAIAGLDVEHFGEALRDGLKTLHGLGIDAILIDPQYSLRTSLLHNFRPYAQYVRQIGEAEDVNALRRFDVMQTYEETGRFDPGAARPAQQRANYNFVHACVARLLADDIAAAVKLPVNAP